MALHCVSPSSLRRPTACRARRSTAAQDRPQRARERPRRGSAAEDQRSPGKRKKVEMLFARRKQHDRRHLPRPGCAGR
ncbi:MAG: hypothetical protein MZW92_16350 [Comamonadaceae bacterium]|nr:hypothetical protein [Comamonadaceae bacterium]